MRQVGLRRVVGLALCATLALLGSATLPASGETSPDDGLLWGAYADKRLGSMDQTSLQRMESTAGRRLGVVREFLSWDSAFPTSYHTWLRDNGYPMILSVKAKRTNGTVVPWADIAAAEPGSALYDDVVRWADRLRDYGAPVRFAFNHEPESRASQAMGGATDFIAAWRRVHDIFVERGATNVDFILIMTDYAFMVGPAASNYGPAWYPGDAYVDAIGIDAYNWYDCRAGISNRWKSLEEIIRPFRDFGALHPDKELWLAEYATVEDPAVPGRKQQWFADAQALFKRSDYAQFAGVSYFDKKGIDNCVWFVDSSASSVEGFRTMGADSFYGGTVTPPPPPPPEPDPVEVSFVASAGSNANKTNHTVQLPASVQAGDTMVLFFTANTTPTLTTPPAGWTELGGREVSGLRSRVWVRTATAGDAGSTVTVANSSITKADLTVAVYRDLDPAVDVQAASLTTTTTSSFVAPSVTPTQPGDWVVVYWADKSSSNTGHTLPAGVTQRRTATGSGSGYITATVADTGAGVGAAPTGTFTAIGTATSNRVVTYTLAFRPLPGG